VGEASLSPAAYSLIADYFRPELRSTAISVYSMGIYLGSGLAFMLGGLVIRFAAGRQGPESPLVGAAHPWQWVFFVVGLPGLLLAPLLLTIREPPRRGMIRSTHDPVVARPVSLPAFWRYIRDNRSTFILFNLGIALLALDGYGAYGWIPSLFVRRYGWTQSQTGLVFGLIVATSGTLGIVTGGRLADWLRLRGHADANLRVALLGAAAWAPFGLFYPLVGSAVWAAALVAPAVFFLSMPFGVAPAAIQQMMPNALRAQASAVYLFVINLIGMGLGPFLVAWVTEDLFRDPNAVGYSLVIVGAAAHAGAVLLLWSGLRPYRVSLEYLERWRNLRASDG
jgi:MFS family permease